MSLKQLLDQRPILVAIAGPNGAGKSSFYESHLAPSGLDFLNADVLAEALAIDAYAAANLANELRRQRIEHRESFIFETVFSDPVGDKVEFLKSAEKIGYCVVLIFIGIDNTALSSDRVAMRVSQGGHDVPAQKLVERYPRAMKNLKRALAELSNVLVHDHSDLEIGYRLVAMKNNGQGIELHEPTPDWLRALLP
ncbi:MAG: zeta toxin family protein [Terracidiphilus sp.]